MTTSIQKEALLARAVSSVRHPVDKAARQALEATVRSSLKSNINEPIRRGLKKARVDKGIGKAVESLTADVPGTPRLLMKARSGVERKALGKSVGKNTVDLIADNPELIPTLPLPLPGVTPLILGGKRVAKRALGIPAGAQLAKTAWLQSFADEIVKIAQSTNSLAELKKKLKPGDILHSKPTVVKRKLFYAVEKKVQGSPFTHSAMYVGDGRVVHSGEKPKKGGGEQLGVLNESLSSYSKRYDFKALRVKASLKDRKKAAEFAKAQVGKDFNLKGMLRLVTPFKGKAKETRAPKEKAESFFCSELVANAYHQTNMANKRKLQHVWPGDLRRSPLTKQIAELEKKAVPTRRVMKVQKSKRVHKPERMKRSHKPWKPLRTRS